MESVNIDDENNNKINKNIISWDNKNSYYPSLLYFYYLIK